MTIEAILVGFAFGIALWITVENAIERKAEKRKGRPRKEKR